MLAKERKRKKAKKEASILFRGLVQIYLPIGSITDEHNGSFMLERSDRNLKKVLNDSLGS